MVEPVTDELHRIIFSTMSTGEDLERRTVIGSTAQWFADDTTGEIRNTQVPTWGEFIAIRFILEPIVKRAKFKNEREAREGTPWHLIGHVLNILARMELTRQKVIEEAMRALELNSNLKKGKNKATEDDDDPLLLPDNERKTLKYLTSSKLSDRLREQYMLISLQLRRMHIYETLRTRTPGVDELIKKHFPQNLTTDTSNLYIAGMKGATPAEIKSYSVTRLLAYRLYRDVDIWEDGLQKRNISEDMMNGLSRKSEHEFSYPEEFERKFPPFEDWTKIVTLTLGWSKSVLNMVTTLEEAFKPKPAS